MKFMLRPEWRLWPFTSFLGLLDLKTGVTVALLFAVCSVCSPPHPLLTGTLPVAQQSSRDLWIDCCAHGGQWDVCPNKFVHLLCACTCRSYVGSQSGQISVSMFPLVCSIFIPDAQENPKYTLYFAHLFFADHILSTAWTVFFGVVWWVYTPHDGRRQANSAAQEEMMKNVHQVGSGNMTDEERVRAATMIWNKEKGTAAIVITLSWLAKVRPASTDL